jgi:hypothetical protein
MTHSTDDPSDNPDNDAVQTFTLELEIDTEGHPISPEDFVATLVDEDGLTVTLVEDERSGYGFGMAEVVTIAIAVGASVSSDLIASAIKSSLKAVIRRVKGERTEGAGSDAELTRVIEDSRRQTDEGS